MMIFFRSMILLSKGILVQKKMMELLNNLIKHKNYNRIKHFFILLRLSHWSKAMFVMLGFIYTPAKGYFFPALFASLAFCLMSSAVYIYNDIEDRSEDSLHPKKCQRPLASELISVSEAIFTLFLLLFSSLILGWLIS